MEQGIYNKIITVWETIGPPQLKLYAVDPVGVDTINPSAQKEFKNSPLM